VRALRILYPLFLISGFCGLIYESIWASYLKLFLGHAAYAQAVVLVVFIGGMAVGAWLCGRFAYRFRNPLAAYAIAEFAVGVAALFFHRVFVASTDWAYATLLPAACSGEGLCYASWVFAALLILPQSILLGSTFPLMAAGIMRRAPAQAGRIIATLYFVNSLGAVFGVLAATFVLVPAVGLPGASLTAGLANLLLAFTVYLYARSGPVPAAVPAPAVTSTRAGTTSTRTLLVVALLTGLTSFVYEVVWIRMLSLVLGASTHAFEIMLATFILGLALGGAWVRGRIDTLADSRRFLANVQIAMGLLAVATLALYNPMYDVMAWMLRTFARTDSGYVLFNLGSSLIAMIIMLPAALMAGMTLPLITQLLLRTQEGERSIGYVYGWNTFGGIVGVLLAVHVGLPHLGLKLSLAAAALVDVGIGAFLLFGSATAGRVPRTAVVAASAALFAVLAVTGDIDPYRMMSSVYRSAVPRLSADAKILYVGDGKTSTVTVFETFDGVRTIQTNGKPDASIDMTRTHPTSDEHTQTLLATLPFAYRSDIRDVAVIGHGSGMTTAAVLAHPGVRQVDTIEIEPAMVAGAAFFRPVVDATYTDPRSHVVFDDARSYLARTGKQYDVIVSEPSNPWVSGVASLFTSEFYRHMRSSLRPNGLLVQWIHMYESNGRALGSIVHALGDVFGDFEIYGSSGDLYIVAPVRGQNGPLRPAVFDDARARAMLDHLDIRSITDLETRRVAGRRSFEQLLRARSVPANSDYFPVVDGEAARARFKREQVDVIANLPTLALPVVELFEQRPWQGTEWPSDVGDFAGVGMPWYSSQAAAAVRSFGASMTSVPVDSRSFTAVASDVAALRALFVDCVSADAGPGLTDSMLGVATMIDRSLNPPLAARFWDSLLTLPCSAGYPDRARWLRQFKAVAQRDPAAIAELSRGLLEGTRSPLQREYLVSSAYAGLRADNRLAQAEDFKREWLARLPEYERNAPTLRAISLLSPVGAPKD